MARSNKYASVNFNEIYGPKKSTSSSSSSSSSPSTPLSSSQSSSPLSGTRSYGRMLILTRPTKPQTAPLNPRPRTPPEKPPAPSPSTPETDTISVLPLGHTTNEVKESQPLTPPKPEPFVPPHLRPGFAGREERPDQYVLRERQGFRTRDRGHQGHERSGYDEETGRPKSGGGREGMRWAGPDLERNRPRSGGSRPSSSGCNASSRSPPSPSF